MNKRKISVIGLGYVGLPVAVAFARAGFDTIGFDINPTRIAELKAGHDRTGEIDRNELVTGLSLGFADRPEELQAYDFHIVTVPTPVTANNQPDFRPLVAASHTVGGIVKRGDIIVYESTVYPGATEEVCVPILEQRSGLKLGVDFEVGYSPERINPGDREHRFENIMKVVSASSPEALEIVAKTYGSVVRAGVHRATGIKVAEAAKVIENTQRDLNIALMNELALIFDKLGIRTKDVLEAAGTKWNFLRFTPGLVGGHCIGVDPYYLTAKAEMLGYHPEVILAGRRTNDTMGIFIAQKLIKLLVAQERQIKRASVGLIGLTFKENVPDLRNSKVPDIVQELREYGIDPVIFDPVADPAEAQHEYGLELSGPEKMKGLDAVILAVPHDAVLSKGAGYIKGMLNSGGILIDVKSAFVPDDFADYRYWSL